MNPITEAIERDGKVRLPDGTEVTAHSGVSSSTGAMLRRAVERARPRVACEVGLAYGISTLYILDAMRQCGDGELIGMDPAQNDGTWRGGGLHNIRLAGFEHRYQFHEEASQKVLPRLAAAGQRIQFAFIDGWHTFDHTLVDFFYLDQMMDVGGVIVLDDVGYPGLQRLGRFIITNRDYAFVEGEARHAPTGWRQRVKSAAQGLLHPLVRDGQTPSPASRELGHSIDRCKVVVLQKRGNDTRRFDHFVPF